MGQNAIGRWRAGGGLQVECARELHETLLVPVLMYGSETMLWREKERSRVMAVQMDNLRGLLGIKRMDRISNARIKVLCRVRKGLDERIDEGTVDLSYGADGEG